MKLQPPQSTRVWRAVRPGMTLIELTVVILVLLTLISVLFVGARAWKRGSDRAGCILQIRNVQTALRSYSNLNGYRLGQDVSPRDLKSDLIGPDRFVETTPECPGAGTYKFAKNKIPKYGKLYMHCSLDKDQHHVPSQYGDW